MAQKNLGKAAPGRQKAETAGVVQVFEAVPSVTSIPSYYVNHMGIETSVWDVRLTLGETLEVDRDNSIVKVRELAIVRMSPQHARVVVALLARQLENYERQFGRIPHPVAPSEQSEKKP